MGLGWNAHVWRGICISCIAEPGSAANFVTDCPVTAGAEHRVAPAGKRAPGLGLLTATRAADRATGERATMKLARLKRESAR